MHLDISQAKLRTGFNQKTGFLSIAVEQLKLSLGKQNRQGNAGQTRSGANIKHSLPLHQAGNTETVEQMARDLDPLEVAAWQWRMCVETACREGRALPRPPLLQPTLDVSNFFSNLVLAIFWQTLRGSFSAVSKRIFASKYSLESS